MQNHTNHGGVPGLDTPESGDGLTTPHSQPAKSVIKIAHILRAIRIFINRATSGYSVDRGIGLESIVMLILAVFMLIQGVIQWMH